MKKKYTLSLFIFRRDLRVHDNRALQEALAESELVIPCFIFDPQQIGTQNSYRSDNCIQFMLESLDDLAQEYKKNHAHLYLFHGDTHQIVTQLITKHKVEALYINRDYTPFSVERDAKLEELCEKHNITFSAHHDALLHAPETTCKSDGKPYTVFTPFWKNASSMNVPKPLITHAKNYFIKPLLHEWDPRITLTYDNPQLAIPGGRTHGLKILKKIAQFKNYQATRDLPALETTHLSPHNKFGTISIREVYYALEDALGKGHPLSRQLYWRDFFTQIAFYFPHVFGHAFHKKYDGLRWNHDEQAFRRWCNGTTGFPIVDAGMRELNATGFMHNRVRMITASFLIKDLHIDWRKGERYFAQKLVDYDPAVNNGNWQWVASTGCDVQPYFRIFNPWLQQKKFDPECSYIKRWIPELKEKSKDEIHAWYKQQSGHKKNNYPSPMLDHASEAELSKRYYKVITQLQ